MDHYFSGRPHSEHERQTIRETIRGRQFVFTTDSSVFSRRRVDFGSRFLIETVELGDADDVLDLGCGYGPIGIVAATLVPQGHVTMVDVNERAVELSRENCATNGVRNATALVSDGFAGLPDARFDAILLNPPVRAGKAVVYRLLEESHEHLNPGGSLWVVIQTKQGARTLAEKLRSLYPEVTEVAKEAGYRIYRATRQA